VKDRQSNIVAAHGGFTLTEMLVVMGVMLCLMGILFPVIGRSYDHAQVAQCEMNLRQLSEACAIYAEENSGLLPWPNWSACESTGQTGWLYCAPVATNPYASVIQQGVIWPYLHDSRLYRCHGDRAPWKLGPTQLLTSYMMNGSVCGFGKQTVPNRLDRMSSTGIEFWESAGSFKGGSAVANEAQTQRHGDRGACIVCFDGHAELLVHSQWVALQARSPGRLWCNPKTKNGH
jgi:prepilin-type N-terminal cleavage/methylation domain-containing protein